MTRYTREAGRTIYKDGKPFISIHACGQCGVDYDPVEVDELTGEIARKVFNCDYDIPSDWDGKLAEDALAGWQQIDSHAWRLVGTNWEIRWYGDSDGYWVDRAGQSDERLPRSFTTLNAAKRCVAQLRRA